MGFVGRTQKLFARERPQASNKPESPQDRKIVPFPVFFVNFVLFVVGTKRLGKMAYASTQPGRRSLSDGGDASGAVLVNDLNAVIAMRGEAHVGGTAAAR